MKINKFKALSVAICYLIAALWTESQCAEGIRRNDEQPVINHQTGFIPAGNVMAFAGEMIPNGWLLCDGSPYHNQDYPELYQVIGLRYVNTSAHRQWVTETNTRDNKIWFCVPDLRGCVIVGVDGGAGRVTTNNIIGESGGAESVTMRIDHMPKHFHDFQICGSDNRVLVPSGSNYGIPYDGAPKINGSTTSVGGDQPHNNMQPYTCLNYMINTGIGNRQNNQNINSEIIDQLQRQILDLNITLASLPVMPIGSIMEYSGSVGISANFLECNGAAVSRINYAQLFANIGTTYGSGDNVTTFNLPDKRGRVSVGIDSNNNSGTVTNATAPNITLGGIFGHETHVLDISEMPAHNFTVFAASGNHSYDYSQAGQGRGIPRGGDINTNSIGGSQPHNNMQPSIFVIFYIRAI